MSTFQNQQSSQTSYHAGVDLGMKKDHSAVGVVQKGRSEVFLVHLKEFRLGSEYGSVLGYITRLNNKLGSRRIMIDQTGVGEVFVEEAIKSGLKNASGVILSLPKKQEIMVYLKKLMQDQRIHLPYDRDFLNELNVERYKLNKTGHIEFSHPEGTHDDRFWAFALAVFVSRPEIPEYHPFVATGRNPNSLMPNLPRGLFKPHLP